MLSIFSSGDIFRNKYGSKATTVCEAGNTNQINPFPLSPEYQEAEAIPVMEALKYGQDTHLTSLMKKSFFVVSYALQSQLG